MFYLRYMVSELRRRKGRTFLTALGLGVGVGLVVTVAALSSGLDKARPLVVLGRPVPRQARFEAPREAAVALPMKLSSAVGASTLRSFFTASSRALMHAHHLAMGCNTNAANDTKTSRAGATELTGSGADSWHPRCAAWPPR
jgi:hypothetical protein